jgi:hypothetical protein
VAHPVGLVAVVAIAREPRWLRRPAAIPVRLAGLVSSPQRFAAGSRHLIGLQRRHQSLENIASIWPFRAAASVRTLVVLVTECLTPPPRTRSAGSVVG